MAPVIDYDVILSNFDDLVARKIIYYAPRTTTQFVDDGFAVRTTPRDAVSLC